MPTAYVDRKPERVSGVANTPTVSIGHSLIRAGDRLAVLLPWPRQPSTCFINLRPTAGGPGNFVRKLAREFQRQEISVTFRRLRSAQGALLFSVSWGDWFHRLCRLWGVRTVLRVNGFMVPSYFDNRPQPPGYQDRRLALADMALNYRLQRDLHLSDFVIYQSAFCKQMADHFLYDRRENYAIVLNGVDLDQFRPVARRPGRRRLLSAGSLRHEYVLGTVLPVFSRLWQQHDLELLIVGSRDNVSRRGLESFCQKHPQAAERIRVIGPVPNAEMPRHMREADILVHPRLGDSCPNTVVEAMACGLPVVCGSWGGVVELVGEGGIVVPTEEWAYGERYVKDLAEAVERILGDLERYRGAARARAEAKFDIRATAHHYSTALGIAI